MEYQNKGSTMGFKINHRKKAAKTLGISLDEMNELLKRMNGHFRKFGVDNDEIAKSFFILKHILDRKEQQRIDLSIPILKFTQKGVKKYRVEIVKMFDDGLSINKIYKELKLKKDAPSLSTIKRYISALKDWRQNNG